MIKPFLKNDALLADIRAAQERADQLHLWWLGQSGFLVQSQQRHLLLDPYLSDSLTKKYATTDKPHVRMTERPLAPQQLDFIDLVTSSHSHTDHLDAETLIPLMQANPQLEVLVPAANVEMAADRLGVKPGRLQTLDAGESKEIAGFNIHAVPAAHETVERDEHGRCRYLGYVVRCAGHTVYHSGDTMLYEGIHDQLRRWSIDVAILPINGRAPERRVAGNLWGREAAELAHQVGAGLAIPCHYDMFTFNTASPEEFMERCRQLGQKYQVLQCGQRCSIP